MDRLDTKNMLEIIKRLLNIKTDSWSDYLAQAELQKKLGLETMSCVSQAICNMVEMQFNYLIKKEEIKGEDLEWLKDNGYILNGKVQFSKRFLAKVSRTSKEGNYGNRVIQSVMEYGLVPEVLYSWNDEDTWSEYYANLEPMLLKDGKEFLKRFNLTYKWEWRKDWEEVLKYSPIACAVYAWRKKGLKYYKPLGKSTNHFVTAIDNKINIWDSYKPFIKQLDNSNYPTWGIATRIYLLTKQDNMSDFIKKNDQQTVFNDDTGETGFVVRGALATFPTIEEKLNGILDMKNRGVLNRPAVHVKDELWLKIPKKRFNDL